MNDDELEVAILAAWLRDTDFGWLDEVTCADMSESAIGRQTAEQILRLNALYQAVRREFPNLKPSQQMLDTFMHPDSDLYRRFFWGPLDASCEMGRSGCHIGIQEVVAAAHLGEHGDVQAVLTACDLLCHGYDYFGGDGRPLVDEYRYFLPAVASYTSAVTPGPLASVEGGPGWWDSDGGWNPPTVPNRLMRALNGTLDATRRRALVGDDRFEQVDCTMFAPVAIALGIDQTFLTPDELAAAEEDMELNVAELAMEEPEEYPQVTIDYVLEPMHLAYTIGKHLDGLLDDAKGLLRSDTDALAQLRSEQKWLADWASESWRRADSWPEGLFREAIESSPWEQFVR